MKILSSYVDRIAIEKDCSFVIKTNKGIEVTMYGNIKNGEIDESQIDASFWNKDIYDLFSDEEKDEIVDVVAKELKGFL